MTTTPMIATEYPHVETDARGRTFVKGSRVKVLQLVKDRVYYDWPAEEIQRQHPGLTLAQVYSALAYYLDHKDDFDALLLQEERADDEYLASRGPSDLHDRLAAHRRDGKEGVP